MSDIIIETKGLCKYYRESQHNEVRALDKVNISIKKGDFIAIIGHSGSGKSTLLHMIGLLDKPTHGKTFFDGQDVSELSDNEITKIRRKKIGFVFQQFNLIPLLTALENVELPMSLDGIDALTARKRAEDLLKKVGLENRLNNRPSEMSGGEQQRVAIARAMANNPEIILADEPTGNLDTKTGKEIINILKNIDKKNFTLIIITHDSNVANIAEKQIKLKDGKIMDDSG